MDKDFLDKFIEHGNGQFVEVLIFFYQSDKAVSVLFVLFIIADCLFKSSNFSGKGSLFLCILSVQHLIAAVRQFAQHIVLIDFTEQDFQLGNPLLCGGKACALFTDFCGLLAGLRFLHHTDKLGSVVLGILGNRFQHIRYKGQYHIFIDTVLGRTELADRNLRDFLTD